MGALENEALLRKGYSAMAGGDPGTVVAMFGSDGVMHIGGPGPFQGDHQGPEAIGANLGQLFEWTGGTMRMDVEDIFADDTHGVAVIRESATRVSDGKKLDVRETHLFRFDPATGLVSEFWDIPALSDREAHDEFFS